MSYLSKIQQLENRIQQYNKKNGHDDSRYSAKDMAIYLGKRYCMDKLLRMNPKHVRQLFIFN